LITDLSCHINSTKLTFLILLLIFFSLSCSDSDKEKVKNDLDTVRNSVKKDLDTLKNKLLPGDTLFNSVNVKEVMIDENVSKNLHDNLEDVFEYYINIKYDLADNDSVDSKKHAMEMLEVVTKAANESDKDIDKSWSAEGSKIMKYQKIIESTTTLTEQREWFNKLSTSLLDAILKYGLPGKTIYQVESEISSGEKTSKWLTDSKNSDNPYTGIDSSENSVNVLHGWKFKER